MIKIENLNKSFRSEVQTKIFGIDRTQVLHGINFEVEKGKCLGILGESGSGKSTLGRIICGLLEPDDGTVTINGKVIKYSNKKIMKHLQNNISVVFQDYNTSANPRFTVEQIIGEGLKINQMKTNEKFTSKDVDELLESVNLPPSFKSRFPHELSGGQRQRVCIARAIACRTNIIVFDEAISSLDMHTGVEIMDTLIRLQKERNLTYIFITHDLTSITYICDEVLFLHKGVVVEKCDINDISKIENSYAKKLINSVFA